MKKRSLSSLLCLCMVLTLLPTAAFAAGGTGIDYEKWKSDSANGGNSDSRVIYDTSGKYSSTPAVYVTLWGLKTLVIEDTDDGKLRVTSYNHGDVERIVPLGTPVVVRGGEGGAVDSRIEIRAAQANVTFYNVKLSSTGGGPVEIQNTSKTTLTLVGESTLRSGREERAGLCVKPGASLTIQGAGSLETWGGDFAAGIGGGNIGENGYITINSGTVTAHGGKEGAGIGSGNESNLTNKTITINGGVVYAYGGDYGAGIGGGDQGSNGEVVINGGTVTATGGSYSAGIGGGDNGRGGTITINGGTVNATGHKFGGAGIGGGEYGDGGIITIIGGKVTAIGGNSGAGIGGGQHGDGGNVTISGGTVIALSPVSSEGKSGAIGSGGEGENPGSLTVTGGSILATDAKDVSKGDGESVDPRAKDGKGVELHRYVASLSGIADDTDISRLTLQKSDGTRIPYSSYGLYTTSASLYSGNGTLYLYLPYNSSDGKSTDLGRIVLKNGSTYVNTEANPNLYAKASYTVTYNANGGDGTAMPAQSFAYGAATELNANTFTRFGYAFLGWSTVQNATAATYADGQSVRYINSNPKVGLVTLYAVWAEQRNVALSYVSSDASMGSVSPASEKISAVGSATGSTAAPNPGYSFDCWISQWGFVLGRESNFTPTKPTSGYTSATYMAIFKANTYRIGFDDGVTDGSVSGSMPYQAMTYGTAAHLTANTFTRPGYTFQGWQVSGSQTFFADGMEVSNLTTTDGDFVTLQAIWQPNPDTVLSYTPADANTGSVSRTYDTCVQGLESTPIAAVTAAPGDGYHFVKWVNYDRSTQTGVTISTDATLTAAQIKAQAQSGGHYTSTAFVAYFAPNEYTVSFDKNSEGATGEMASQAMTHGTAAKLTANGFTFTGHTFAGWATDKNAAAAQCSDRQSVENLSAENGGTVTLYAVWVENEKVVLSYTAADAAMGSVSPASESVLSGSTAAGSAATAKDGYHFDKWTKDSVDAGTAAKLEPGTVTAAAAYTANFKANTYTVIFDDGVDDGSVTGTMGAQSLTYGQTANLTANGFTRPGCTFGGWYVKGVTPVQLYKDEAGVRNLTSTHDGTVTLVAIWTAIPDAVLSYTPDNANHGGASPTYVKLIRGLDTSPSKVTAVTATAAAGYHFDKWTLYGGTASVGDAETLTVDQINANAKSGVRYVSTAFIARFAPNRYTVKFDANTGSGTMENQSMTYDTAAALTANTFTNSGKTFVGWARSASGAVAYKDRQSVINLTAEHNAEIILYAVWEEAQNVTLSYLPSDADYGSVSTAAEGVAPVSGNPGGSTASENPGYRFMKWTEFGTGAEVGATAALSANEINAVAKNGNSYVATTFVANFTPNTYTITFNANTGSGVMSNQSMTYGEAAKLTSNGFTRRGYAFSGWNAGADGLGQAYADSESVSNLTTEQGGSVTLYAQWTELPKVTVSYRPSNSAMGSVSLDFESLNPETGSAAGSTAEANSGYRFVSWTKDGTVVTTDATLTAALVNAYAMENGKYVSTTFAASFETFGFGGSSGGDTSAVTVPISSDAGKTDVTAAVSGSTVGLTITDTQLETVVSSAETTGTVTVDVSDLKSVDSAKLPAELVKAAAETGSSNGLEIKLPTGTVELDATALAAVNSGKDVTVSVEEVKNASLTSAQKAALGNQADTATVIDVNILVDQAKQSGYNGGVLTVSISYTLKTGESADSVVVWFLNDDGTLTPHATTYKNGVLTFTTTHLSEYVVASFPFADVAEDSYYYNAAAWAYLNDVTGGTSDTTFSPNAACTRAHAVTFLWRASGSPEPTATVNPFTDVSKDAYYYKAVLWAVEKSITKGTSNIAFSPDDTCSRAQIVTLQYRAAGSPAAAHTANPFTDVADSAYYANAVKWAVVEGITEGASATTFSPDADCTRAQIVTFLCRQFKK